ncbi:MAG: LPFR motif small protein [Pseudonocardiaceae bacterium]
MAGPARRAGGAVSTIIGTIISVITLPFRLIAQLFGRSPGPRR